MKRRPSTYVTFISLFSRNEVFVKLIICQGNVCFTKKKKKKIKESSLELGKKFEENN